MDELLGATDDELEDLDELDTAVELDDLDELDTTTELDELEITAELDDLDELDITAELDATLELNELDFRLELTDEFVELLDFVLDVELGAELLATLDCTLELATDVLLDELDFTLALLADELVNDELEPGVGLGPVLTTLELVLVTLEAATEEGARLLLTALPFEGELIAVDELDRPAEFERLDEFVAVLDELVTSAELELLPLLPLPPPPPPHAVSETTVINAPKSTTFVFTDMQASELVIKIPRLMLSI